MKVSCKEEIYKATRLRLMFTGGESLLTYDVGPDLIHSQNNQLFGISSTLWKRNGENNILQTGKTYKFSFTIQMPLIQFPPSMSHSLYKCTYKLCACLDLLESYSELPVTTSANINYIPLLETRLLKSPIYLDNIKKRKQHKSRWMTIPSIKIKLHSMEYISGDTIDAIICIANQEAASSSSIITPSFKFDYSITANLYQVCHFHHSQRTAPPQLVGTQSYSLDLNENIHEEETQHHISLKLESYLPPSFDFSKILSFSYKLRVKVYVKRARTSLSSAPHPPGAYIGECSSVSLDRKTLFSGILPYLAFPSLSRNGSPFRLAAALSADRQRGARPPGPANQQCLSHVPARSCAAAPRTLGCGPSASRRSCSGRSSW